MFRSGFIIIIVLCVILEVSSLIESTVVSKRVQKCLWYSPHIDLLGTTTCKISSKHTQAIEIQKFPHIAIIGDHRSFDTDGIVTWDCHGTLVSSRFVLTSGRCAKNPYTTPVKVRLGANNIVYMSESNSSDYDIENIIVHPLYRFGSAYNDVGLIKLSRTVEFSENVRPICLPDSDLKPSTVYQVYYEWTENENPVQRPLAVHEQRIEPNEQCNEMFANHRIRRFRNGVTNEFLCSFKPTNLSVFYTSRGESGAPLYIDHPDLICSHIQLGIASVGLPQGSRVFDVATKVFDFMDWIESVIWADGDDFQYEI